MIVNTELDLILEVMKKAHIWKPDFMEVWNIGYDMNMMLNVLKKNNIKPEDVYEVEYIGDYGGIIEPKQDFYDTNLIGGKFALTNIKDYFVNLTDADNFWKKKERH
jgi:hypothetical protein